MKIPPSFDRIGFLAEIFSLGVLLVSSANSKLVNNFDNPIFASTIANLIPMHILGPSPNGMNENACRLAFSVALNLSGLNSFGFS